MRGSVFGLDDYTFILDPSNDNDNKIAEEALVDVAKWLGFKNEDHYLDILNQEGVNIFERAEY